MIISSARRIVQTIIVALRCRACDASCSMCAGALARDCVACAVGLAWQEGVCVLNCTEGHFSSLYSPDGPVCTLYGANARLIFVRLAFVIFVLCFS